MSCPKCAGGLPPDIQSCPDCGAANSAFDETGSTRASGAGREDVTQTAVPVGAGEEPGILGFVILYSDSAESPAAGPDTRIGRAVPMRAGDVFFLGKSPLPTEVPASDGRKVAPTQHHLFPFTEDYAHISRRHLVVEMMRGGRTVLTDLSTNGIYLVKAAKHCRRPRDQAFQAHTLEGEETVALGVDLSTADEAERERAGLYRIQIVPVKKGDSRGRKAR